MWVKTLFKTTWLATLFAAMVYFNIVLLQNAFVGWVVLVAFLLWSSKAIHDFLVKYFSLSRATRIRALSVFVVLAVLGFVAGALSWVFKMTPLVLAATFFITGLAVSYLKKLADDKTKIIPEIEDNHKQVIEEVPSSKVGLILYIVLVFAGFYFLSLSKTETSILTPWQTISVSYIYIFFAATLVLGFLIFSKLKSGTILLLLILHSLLLHAYLPLSHSLFYGADGWRHLAIQNSMLSDGVGKTLLFSDTPISFWQRYNFGGLAYAQFNSLALLFKLICQTDLIVFLKYFIPIVWSVVLPILLFEFARVFGWEKKRALLFVWLSALPFALQVSGSFGLPSNLSLLFWLLILLLHFKNQLKPSLVGKVTILILGILSVFGHSLYTILFGLSWVLFWWLNDLKTKDSFKKIKITVAILLSISLIPILEIISNFSKLSFQINWWAQMKAVISSLTAWYVATGLRTSDITAGNIIFNQPPLNALVVNIFTTNRWWVCAFMLLFWLAFILGWSKILKKQKDSNVYVWTVLTVGLLSGYIISRYFLIGENILSRRLDAVLAVLLILPVAYYLYEIIISQKNILHQRIILFLVILFSSAATTASYTLGPDVSIVSQSQYLAADYVWQKKGADSERMCVLSDTHTLLILEGLSGKKIVGGGFPMNLYFVQSEREQMLELAKIQPQLALAQSKKILNINSCYLIGNYDIPNPEAQFGNIKIYSN